MAGPTRIPVAFAEGWRAQRLARAEAELPEELLSRADPRLGRLIERVISEGGLRRYPEPGAASAFDALARSIIYQNLSGKAAATIFSRYLDLFQGRPPDPEELLRIPVARLRRAGLSRTKALCLRDLARQVRSGRLQLDQLANLDDEAVIKTLVTVRGVGRWTAQMFLMFELGRPDVLPADDLGVRKGLALAHGLRRPAAPGYVQRAGRRWIPHRSLACLYLWAALELGLDRGSGWAGGG